MSCVSFDWVNNAGSLFVPVLPLVTQVVWPLSLRCTYAYRDEARVPGGANQVCDCRCDSACTAGKRLLPFTNSSLVVAAAAAAAAVCASGGGAVRSARHLKP